MYMQKHVKRYILGLLSVVFLCILSYSSLLTLPVSCKDENRILNIPNHLISNIFPYNRLSSSLSTRRVSHTLKLHFGKDSFAGLASKKSKRYKCTYLGLYVRRHSCFAIDPTIIPTPVCIIYSILSFFFFFYS